MQLIPRYLVKERINVVSSETGFVTEYRPVYTRQLKVYRGINNKIQFRLLNTDQKPVHISGIPMFVAFDEDGRKVLEYAATVTDDGSTRDTRGTFEVTIYESDLLPIQQQYLHYNIFIDEGEDQQTLTYAGRNFDSAGSIFIDAVSFPGPKPSVVVKTFYKVDDVWVAGNSKADLISANPGVNGFDALHTVAIYVNGYVGNIKIQATLEQQLVGQSNWFDVDEIDIEEDDTHLEPIVKNFNGVYRYLRFVFDEDPTDTIEKILIRN